MKKTYKKNISEMNKIAKHIPKTINEAIDFNGFDEEYEEEPEVEGPKPMEPISDSLNAETFINDTRKKSLQIMAKLADEPESKTYEIAKRIWQICDKSLSDEKNEQDGDIPMKHTR